MATLDELQSGLKDVTGIRMPGYGSKKNTPNIYNSIKSEGITDLRQMSTNINYGFNISHQSLVHRPNIMDKGFVFFTRPQLALDEDNLLRDTRLYSFLNTDVNSVHHYVRCLLDPRLCYEYNSPAKERDEASKAVADSFKPDHCPTPPMLNNTNPFLTILTNCLKKLSGFPDASSGFFVTEPNIGGGQTIIVDKHNRERGKFSLSATFFNPQGNALPLLLYLWKEVQSLTWEGVMHPYPDFIANNIINYKTAVYRFTLDESRKHIVMPAKTIATLDAPDLSRLLDYDSEQGKVREDLDININFQCEGFDINNPYILVEFNQTVAMGNAKFVKLLSSDLSGYTKEDYKERREKVLNKAGLAVVPPVFRDYFNFRAIPWCNLHDMSLEWIVETDSAEYKYLVNNLKK